MFRTCVCGKPIKGKHDLCSECEFIYGAPEDWDEWLRFMVSDKKREYEQEKRLCDREIVFSDMDDPDNNFEE